MMEWQALFTTGRGPAGAQKGAESRSVFEQDYDRIVFSHPFRRLQDKTQVHPLPEHDFVHTRLTHSLEVSSVGRSLGKRVGETLIARHQDLSAYSLYDFGAIVAAAALAHDLGNPPFGHTGEASLSDFFSHQPEGAKFKKLTSAAEWEDLTNFEGNAQGFRILNKNQYGLKLTPATLGAFTKYPCPALMDNRDRKKKSQKKFGFFQTEKDAFLHMATQLQLTPSGEGWLRHPLAFLVEAADDICYNIIDLEDGCRLGLVTLDETVDLMAAILGDRFDRTKLQSKHNLNEKLGVLRAMVIGQLVDECAEVFLDNETAILSGQFDQALTDVCTSHAVLKEITAVSLTNIYQARHVLEIEASGHKVLPGLLQAFTEGGFYVVDPNKPARYKTLSMLLPTDIRQGIIDNPQPYAVLRLVLDFVSGLTDRHALGLYKKVMGL